MSPSSILVIAETPIKVDARVSRQLGFLVAGGYSVECACLAAGTVPGVSYLPFGSSRRSLPEKLLGAALLVAGFFSTYYWRRPFIRECLDALKGRSYGAIIANDADTLPLALALSAAGGGRVLFDAHEYAPAQYGHSLKWRILFGRYSHWLISRFAARADAMFTVGAGIARLYEERYGLEAKVLTNAPAYEAGLSPSAMVPGTVRMVHHGSINKNRQIELMIKAMDELPEGYHLDLMIVNNYGPYYDYLKSMAGPKVSFVPPVAVETVAASINGYDLGVYLLPPSNPNQELALPNKFFEFIQGRLAIAVGPSPEMASYVQKYALGVAAEDYSPAAFAKAILGMSPAEIQAAKEASDRAAKELSADANKKVLLETLREVLG